MIVTDKNSKLLPRRQEQEHSMELQVAFFSSFASLNKKVKSICLLKRGTSVRQASAHLEIAISSQMKAEWFETLTESTSLAGPLIFKQAGLIDMHLPLLPSPKDIVMYFRPSSMLQKKKIVSRSLTSQLGL